MNKLKLLNLNKSKQQKFVKTSKLIKLSFTSRRSLRLLLLGFNFWIFRSSQWRCSRKKNVLTNFEKFTGKHLRRSVSFNKVACSAFNFIKKETLAQVFSCEFWEILKNTFFTEHLRMFLNVPVTLLSKWEGQTVWQKIDFTYRSVMIT